MTTICWDGKTLAGDRQVSFANLIAMGEPKICRTPDGRLLGAAGDAASCDAMIDWLNVLPDDRGELPEFQMDDDTSVTVLEIDIRGDLFVWQANGCFKIDAPFAYGSGAHFALGAMASGKSAKQAVEIAAMFDTGTGGKIDTLKIKV